MPLSFLSRLLKSQSIWIPITCNNEQDYNANSIMYFFINNTYSLVTIFNRVTAKGWTLCIFYGEMSIF